jgi:hypothetical protein
MQAYVGMQARVTSLTGTDSGGCPVVNVDVDGGAYYWRIRDMTILAELTPQALSGAGVRVCLVTDTEGIDDRSFNATAWRGVLAAQEAYGITGEYLESSSQANCDTNIEAFLHRDCDLIVTVGFFLGDATAAAARANPGQRFTIVDFSYDPPLPNVLGQTYRVEEAAFLAGYLAAGVTRTGKVGTFGGMDIPPWWHSWTGLPRGWSSTINSTAPWLRFWGAIPACRQGRSPAHSQSRSPVTSWHCSRSSKAPKSSSRLPARLESALPGPAGNAAAT